VRDRRRPVSGHGGDSVEVISAEAMDGGRAADLEVRNGEERKREREREREGLGERVREKRALTDNGDRFGLRGPAGRAEVHARARARLRLRARHPICNKHTGL